MRRLERAWLLHDRGRHDDAIEFLHQHLASQPEDSEAMGLLALSHAAKKEYDAAERCAREGVGHAPDESFAHYALASVLSTRDKDAEALAAIEVAIALDPELSHYHGFRAMTLLALDRREEGLAAAEQGLALEPTDELCLNMRANALMRLGRNREARATLETALAEDPDSPHTHASQGWVALDARKYDQALFHFSEALRRDPNHEWARAGLVQAMKAKNVLYRPLLAYFMFMSKLTEKQRWLVILGVWFGPRVLRSIGKTYPAFYPVAVVVGFCCLALVLVSWLGTPLSNFLLAMNKFGRAALLPVERNVAYLVGGSVCAALACLGVAYFEGAALPFAAAFFIVGFGAAGIEECEPGFPRRAAIGLATVIGAAALVGAALTLTTARVELGISMLGMAFLGAMVATWIVNGLLSLKPKK